MNWPWVLGAWDISMIKKNSPVLSEFTFWDISDETHCILVNLVILLDILVQDNCKFIFWFEVLLFSFIFVFLCYKFLDYGLWPL